ncbi:SPRY domain-containing protein 3 isoform X2 [Hyalella azteca]|uniref:SPRY domain-containing protein 3 isoform X2 n=1 Tax=Hyalella azteca TaxID=294128 RepID=A0A979FL67_HYAAZ|nr:SPRY domain-containing protein 3 isoform X2 [Hyalella azteca]
MEMQRSLWAEDIGDAALSSKRIRAERLLVEGDIIKYTGNGRGIGVFVSEQTITTENSYFELTILNTDMFGAVSIGVCHDTYPLNKMPGWDKDSLGYHGDDGMLYRGNALGYRFGPRCGKNDRMGCGIRPVPPVDVDSQLLPQALSQNTHYVYFTRNGKEIGCVTVVQPEGGLHPCVGLAGPQDRVRFTGPLPPPSAGPVILSPHSPPPPLPGEEVPMLVDHNDDDWSRLHNVKLSGQCLSYCGRGEQIEDVGLAVAKHALCPASHYFQLHILDSGQHAYITIGITKKHYPRRCYPGWRSGSVAYHADDGRVFTGGRCGKGEPLGPPCRAGDVMGCGILFPRDYCHTDANRGSCDESSADESGDDDDDVESSSLACSDDEDDVDDDEERDDDDVIEAEDYEQLASSPGDLLLPDDILNTSSWKCSADSSPRSLLHKLMSLDRLSGDQQPDAPPPPPPAQVPAERRRRRRHQSGGDAGGAGGGDGGGGGGGGGGDGGGRMTRSSVLIREHRPLPAGRGGRQRLVQVFFTRNGCVLGRVEAVVPRGGFFPTISLGGPKEAVRVDLRPLTG